MSHSPYPPAWGSPLRTWQHINVLASLGPVRVFSFGFERGPLPRMPCVENWTHFNISDYPSRRGLFGTLAKIVLPRQYPVGDTFARFPLNRALRAEIERFQPDQIVLSNWYNECPTALARVDNLVLDMHNIESLHAVGLRTDVKSPLLRNAMLWRWRRRERALVRRAERVWVCGSNDATLLKVLDPRAAVPSIVPNAVDVGRYEAVRSGALPVPEPLKPRLPTIIYVGVYRYYPNATAALELIDAVFPLIAAALPATRLLLIGDNVTPEMKRRASADRRIVLTGRVAEIEPYLGAADVCVIPLRTGGGTRLKVLECFAAGVPVVSTSKGAEGIEATPGREIRIAESPRALADEALRLLTDEAARRRQIDAAYRLVESRYSWNALAERVDDFVVSKPASHAARVPG